MALRTPSVCTDFNLFEAGVASSSKDRLGKRLIGVSNGVREARWSRPDAGVIAFCLRSFDAGVAGGGMSPDWVANTCCLSDICSTAAFEGI